MIDLTLRYRGTTDLAAGPRPLDGMSGISTSGGRLEEMTALSPIPAAEDGGPVELADGTTITVPPLPDAVVLRQGVPFRGVVEGGRLVALGRPPLLVHPIDLAITSLVGHDVDGTLALHRDALIWCDPHFVCIAAARPSGLEVVDGRLSSHTHVDEFPYRDGRLCVPLFMFDAELPQTVLTAASGRPLGSLLDVPTLRELDPTIVSAYEFTYALDMLPRLAIDLCGPEGWRPME
jgi:hypothetical protein